MSFKQNDIDKILEIMRELLTAQVENNSSNEESHPQDNKKCEEIKILIDDTECLFQYASKSQKTPVPYHKLIDVMNKRSEFIMKAWDKLILESSAEFQSQIKIVYFNGHKGYCLKDEADSKLNRELSMIQSIAASQMEKEYKEYLCKYYGEQSISFMEKFEHLVNQTIYCSSNGNGINEKGHDLGNDLMNFLLKYGYSLEQSCEVFSNCMLSKDNDQFEGNKDPADVSSLVQCLKELSCLIKKKSPIPQEYNQYCQSIETLEGKRRGYLIFSNCCLVDTHILILCEILTKTMIGTHSCMMLDGVQSFNPEVASKYICEMLTKNPDAIWSLILPKCLSKDENIIKIWNKITEKNPTRTLRYSNESGNSINYYQL